MKKSVTIVLSVVAIVVVAAILLPFIFGFWIHSRYQSLVQAANDRLANAGHVEVQNYQRGWFSSSADEVVTLTVDMPSAAKSQPSALPQPLSKKYTLIFHHKIMHGPILYSSDSHFAKGPLFGVALIHSVWKKPALPIPFRTYVGWKHVNAVAMITQPVSFTEDEANISLGNSTLQTTTDFNLANTSTSLRIDKLDITPTKADLAGKAGLTLQGVTYQGNGELLSTYKWLSQGNQVLTIDNLSLYDHGDLNLNVLASQIKATATGKVENGKYNMAMSLAMPSLKIQHKERGPIQLAIAYKNLDMAALQNLVDLSRQAAVSEAEQTAHFKQFEAAAIDMVTKGLSLDVNFSMNYASNAPVLVKASVNLPAVPQRSIIGLMQMAAAADAQADITLPKALVLDALTEGLTLRNAREAQEKKLAQQTTPAALPSTVSIPNAVATTSAVPARQPQAVMTTPAASTVTTPAVQSQQAQAPAPIGPMTPPMSPAVEAAQILQQALDSHYVVEKDNNLTLHFEYKQGEVKLNGTIFPLLKGLL